MANMIALPHGENELTAPLENFHVEIEGGLRPLLLLRATVQSHLSSRTLPGRFENATTLAIRIDPAAARKLAG